MHTQGYDIDLNSACTILTKIPCVLLDWTYTHTIPYFAQPLNYSLWRAASARPRFTPFFPPITVRRLQDSGKKGNEKHSQTHVEQSRTATINVPCFDRNNL